MADPESIKKVHAFLKDLLPILKKHGATIVNGCTEEGFGITIQDVYTECVDLRGIDPNDCEDLAMEISPRKAGLISNIETVRFSFQEPIKQGFVFNPAGEII